MQNDGSVGNGFAIGGNPVADDTEKQQKTEFADHISLPASASPNSDQIVVTIAVSNVEGSPNPLRTASEAVDKFTENVEPTEEQITYVVSPRKGQLSRNASGHEQCRVCQQEKEEDLIDLGCQCRGGLAKAHLSCITTWFHTRGSNKCEICEQVAVNVPPPELQQSQTSYWVWRVDPALQGSALVQERDRVKTTRVVLVPFGWRSQSSLAVSFWMCLFPLHLAFLHCLLTS